MKHERCEGSGGARAQWEPSPGYQYCVNCRVCGRMFALLSNNTLPYHVNYDRIVQEEPVIRGRTVIDDEDAMPVIEVPDCPTEEEFLKEAESRWLEKHSF